MHNPHTENYEIPLKKKVWTKNWQQLDELSPDTVFKCRRAKPKNWKSHLDPKIE